MISPTLGSATSPTVTFILPDGDVSNEALNENENYDRDDDVLGASSQTPLTTTLKSDSSIYGGGSGHVADDLDDSSALYQQLRYPYSYSIQPNIGLRERTTSQSSAGDIYSSRDRTFSQNSVEQLEAQSQSSNNHHRRNPLGKSNSISNSYKVVNSTPRTSASSTVPLLSYSASQPQQNSRDWIQSFVESIQSTQVPIWLLRHYRKQQQYSTTGKPTKLNAVSATLDNNGDGNNTGIGKPKIPLVPIHEQQQSQRSKHDSENNNNNDHDRTVVYWIQGLDRVLFQKDTCCAQDIRLVGWKPPRYVWFALSGGLCDIIQLGMLYLLHMYVLPANMDTSISWMIAFCTSIFFRHTSHRFFVFGSYIGGYTQSLIRIYMGYSVTIVLSTILNHVLNRMLKVNLFLLAILTMAWTGVVNYFILKYFWNIGKSSSTAIKSTTTSTTIVASSGQTSKSATIVEMIDSQSSNAVNISAKS